MHLSVLHYSFYLVAWSAQVYRECRAERVQIPQHVTMASLMSQLMIKNLEHVDQEINEIMNQQTKANASRISRDEFESFGINTGRMSRARVSNRCMGVT